MKLLNICAAGFVFAHDGNNNSEHDLEHSDNSGSADPTDLADDIKFTTCQKKAMEEMGMDVSELEADEVKCPKNEKAIQNYAPKWDRNFDAAENRYLVGFYFDTRAGHVHSSTEQQNIRDRLAEFGRRTCVKLVEVNQGSSTYSNKLQISRNGNCASYVGRWSGFDGYSHQPVWLGNRCDTGTIPQHETMHALGFWHEHQRGDRDDWVDYHPENINSAYSSHSKTVNWGALDSAGRPTWLNSGHAYDFDSIMHYSAFAGAYWQRDSNGNSFRNPVLTYKGTMTPVSSQGGGNLQLSDSDIEQINWRYPCDLTEWDEPEIEEDLIEDENLTEIEKDQKDNFNKIKEWSTDNNKPHFESKLSKRLGKIQKFLGLLDPLSETRHPLANRRNFSNCINFDNVTDASTDAYNFFAESSEDFQSSKSKSDLVNAFSHLKNYFDTTLGELTSNCPESVQIRSEKLMDKFKLRLDHITSKMH